MLELLVGFNEIKEQISCKNLVQFCIVIKNYLVKLLVAKLD